MNHSEVAAGECMVSGCDQRLSLNLICHGTEQDINITDKSAPEAGITLGRRIKPPSEKGRVEKDDKPGAIIKGTGCMLIVLQENSSL